jgi:hypothetical protein
MKLLYLYGISKTKSAAWCALLLLALSGQPRVQVRGDATMPLTNLPPDVFEQMAKQTSALKTIYLEFSETRVGTNMVGGVRKSDHVTYLEGNLFYDMRVFGRKGLPHGTNELSFDGTHFYNSTLAAPPRTTFLTKRLASNSDDVDYMQRAWQVACFHSAGFYFPDRLSELERYVSAHPLLLHYLKQDDGATVKKEGDRLRVTFQVPDLDLVGARGLDVEKHRASLQSSNPSSPESVNRILESYERMRAMTPVRTVELLLDPEWGYGVVERNEWTADHRRLLQSKSENWKYYEEAGIWLPSRSVSAHYTTPFGFERFASEPIWTQTTELTRVEFGPKQISFNLEREARYKRPGVIIVDRASPEARARPDGAVSYPLGANGQALRTSAQGVMTLRRTMWFVILGLLVIPMFAFLVSRLGTRRKG